MRNPGRNPYLPVLNEKLNLNVMKNCSFARNPMRQLPDGSVSRVFPLHVSLEGKETKVLCRDRNDYDTFVKVIVVSARRRNVILIVYSVVSNHGHSIVLAAGKRDADRFGEEVKKMYSMYFKRKYGNTGVMRGVDVNSQWLDSDWYLRNAIAYDIRNALDNGACSIQDYEWSSYRAYFADRRLMVSASARRVSSLSKSEKRAIMHTNDDISRVDWLIGPGDELIPGSVCDYKYVEDAFENNPTLLIQKIGNVNVAEMSEKMIDSPRTFKKDEDVVRSASDTCRRWFDCTIYDLPFDKKCRLLSYYYRSNRTNVSQLARVFELTKETVSDILKKNGL